ncbi:MULTISPECIES: hypothetical protein [Micromonospora]|uniref:hypothetical protein n=1 Tax=Micromonospora TaxID=1873 RepID=UPI0024164795|nr:hypothetical protein [Micromonospora sp. WMMD718]MDG4756111.1 hypothetical protein [Micromonospora sp. WMMD718]MDG4756232.1 hypothetical protein [Micromonospora sp. WMMD718]
MFDAPTDDDYLSWREHDEHAGDAAEIDAEHRAEARQEEQQRHATATTSCPTCAAPQGQECNQDATHPARMHAASLPCDTGCPTCPVTLHLDPTPPADGMPGHWLGHHKLRVGDEVYGLGYGDHLATGRAAGPKPFGPYLWPVHGLRHRYEPEDLITPPGETLLINGTAYKITKINGEARLHTAAVQPPRSHTLTSTAEEIASAIGRALDRIDIATTALADYSSTAPEPGTPTATLATMRQRLHAAAEDLRAVHQCAEDLTEHQTGT